MGMEDVTMSSKGVSYVTKCTNTKVGGTKVIVLYVSKQNSDCVVLGNTLWPCP